MAEKPTTTVGRPHRPEQLANVHVRPRTQERLQAAGQGRPSSLAATHGLGPHQPASGASVAPTARSWRPGLNRLMDPLIPERGQMGALAPAHSRHSRRRPRAASLGPDHWGNGGWPRACRVAQGPDAEPRRSAE